MSLQLADQLFTHCLFGCYISLTLLLSSPCPSPHVTHLVKRADIVYVCLCRNAMDKMIAIYRQNPSLGDEKAVAQSLEPTLVRLDELNAELYKFKV